MAPSLKRLVTLATLSPVSVLGITVDFQDKSSVKDAASTIAYGLMKFYTGNNTGDVPGNLPEPYYWWEMGAVFGTLIDYYKLTGDKTYNEVLTQGMLHQAGDDRDFMPDNQTTTEGNDDQGFWAMASMSAAENVFPNPPDDQPQWLALTQAVFNEYVSRWDPADCGGGMRWQIFNWNQGYDYKNSISNGCFFNVAARLARYTNNGTYAKWANKVFDWEMELGLITDTLQVFDGAPIGANKKCSKIDENQWTYNAGIFLHGAAAMYDYTKDDKWKDRVDGLLKEIERKFVKDGIIYEQFCEERQGCNLDQQTFKGYLIRWLSSTAQLVPDKYDDIKELILKNGKAAAESCSGSPAEGFAGMPGTACGFSWLPSAKGKFDGLVGVGEQMSALSAVMYTMTEEGKDKGPVTNKTGGTSKGDYNGGVSDASHVRKLAPITTGDRVGAGLLTVVMLAGIIAAVAFQVVPFEDRLQRSKFLSEKSGA